MQRIWLGYLVGGLLLGCTKQPDTTAPALDANGPIAPLPAQPMGADAPKAATGNAFITGVTQVRKEATDAKDVTDEASKKKKVPNWLATLYRGEQVTVVANRNDWLQVQTSDEKTGWVKSDSVVLGTEMATVLDKTKIFTRPDLLALNGAKQIEPGSLLFVQRAKDQFSEVNFGGTATAWVLTDVLTKAPNEVDAAKLLHKARLLKDKNDPAADSLLDLAKTHFASTKLVQALLLPATNPNTPADGNAHTQEGAPADPNLHD